MNVAVRAKRILTPLINYQSSKDVSWLSDAVSGADLGKGVGCYRNSDEQSDGVWILENGLIWFDENRRVSLRFDQISEVTLPHKKESEGLLLKKQDGTVLQLPIKGRRGHFLDSMEMLRFLDRVIQDLRN